MTVIMAIFGKNRHPLPNIKETRPHKANFPRYWLIIIVLPFLAAASCTSCVSKKADNDTVVKIEQFLKNVVAETLETDYHSHNIDVKAVVTDLKIDNLTAKDTYQDTVYFAVGKVTYIIKGKRQWKDKEGNIIQLGPEQEITHWYSCGVLEDKYMHVFYKDEKHRLALYADKPTAEVLQ